MNQMLFDKHKSIESILYVANKLQRRDFHKIFKILYFADREHLSQYGRSITGDTYIAMCDGPVPSNIYDIFKAVRGDGFFANQVKEFEKDVVIENWMFVKPLREANQYYLAASDIAELDNSILKYGPMSWDEVREKSHDSAWRSTAKDRPISVENILLENGEDNSFIECLTR